MSQLFNIIFNVVMSVHEYIKIIQQIILVILGSQLIVFFHRQYDVLLLEKVLMSHPIQTVDINKVLATGIAYNPTVCPQWVSDTQINYMSQYDFITYDLDEDKTDLIQRKLKHQLIAVKYLPLIGNRNVRIVYLYQERKCDNFDFLIQNKYAKIKKNSFGFAVLPSLNFSQTMSLKSINSENKQIIKIRNFIYFSDSQFAMFTFLYSDWSLAVGYFSLNTSALITYDLQECPSLTQNNIQIKSLRRIQETFVCFQQFQQKQLARLNFSTVLFTKQVNTFVVIQLDNLCLLKLCPLSRQFALLDKINIKQYTISSYDDSLDIQSSILSIFLSKTYVVILRKQTILLLSVEEESFQFIASYDTQQIGLQGQVKCIAGSFQANKVFISFKNSSLLYQFQINQNKSSLQFINSVNLEADHKGNIQKIVVSQTGRNILLISLAQNSEKQKQQQHKYKISNVSIFKFQLYTQLKIPQNSLYIRQMKYQMRTKKVHRLVIPRIYQRVFALTGSQIHTLQTHYMTGISYFDIHPCGFFMVVSYSFNIKIYSIECNSMTLLYSTSLQHLKKVQYSPDGSNLVIFSSRKLKILDAYSFQVKQQINEKNNSIIDVCFGQKSNTLLILYDNGIIAQRNFYLFEKIRLYRIYGHSHRRILSIAISQKNECLYLLLEDGSLILKHIGNLTIPQICLIYQDEEKITQIHVDSKNGLLFVGTKNGFLRIHIIYSQKLLMNQYSQVQVTNYEVSSIACSYLQNYVYVGNLCGDITMLKYSLYSQQNYLAKSSKILKNIAPRVSPYFSFQFQIISLTKFHGKSQQNALQDKLQNLVERIQQHTNNYKQSLINNYINKQKQYSNFYDLQENKNAYKDYDAKCKKVKMDIHYCREKHAKIKRDLVEQYETKIKQIYRQQGLLKGQINEKKTRFQVQKQQKMILLQQQEFNSQKQLSQNMNKLQTFYKQQSYALTLTDLDDDYKISDPNYLNSIQKKLSEQLSNLKVRCLQLNKSNSYIQTAKVNIMNRRVQQETLEQRINVQLNLLKQVNNNQIGKITFLTKQLKQTQDLIHHIQNKVKNAPNNVISSDKADSDLCSYKIWMKDKVQQQVNQLEDYLKNLDQNFEQKSQQIVNITFQIKRSDDAINNYLQKIKSLEQRLLSMKYHRVILSNCIINQQKSADQSVIPFNKICQPGYDYEKSKIKRIVSMQKLNQKAVYFQNKHLKMHSRKIRNLNCNNAELIHEYQKLKYQNKWLKNKQIQIKMLTNQANKKSNQKQSQKQTKALKSQRNSFQKIKDTPFVIYIKNRACKTKKSLNFGLLTAASTPRISSTFRSINSSRIKKI